MSEKTKIALSDIEITVDAIRQARGSIADPDTRDVVTEIAFVLGKIVDKMKEFPK